MRIYGVWLYGALSLSAIFAASLYHDNQISMYFVIAALGIAYAAEYVAAEIGPMPDHYLWPLQNTLVGASFACGLISYASLAIG